MVWTSSQVTKPMLPTPTGPRSGLTMVFPSVLPVMMYCVVLIPAASKIGRPLSYMDWYPSSKSIETKPLAVITKDRGADVAAWGAGFDTVTGMVEAAVNSAAGIVTVMVFEVMETGVSMLDPKFTVAPVAKLLPVIVRYVRSVLLVKASGGESRVTIGGAGGGGGGVVTVKNTCPVTEPDVAVICAMPAAIPVATLPLTVARVGFSLLN